MVISSLIPNKSISSIIALISVTYPYNSNVIKSYSTSTLSFMVEIHCSNLTFYDKVFSINSYQCLTTETSAQVLWQLLIKIINGILK